MKIAALLLLCASIAHCAQLQGIDVSGYQPNVNWRDVKSRGIQFVYIKATEGTSYKSPAFNSQYTGATQVGLIRGAYHFARPDVSSGAAQANFFLSNGGGWSRDGRTLPGVVDLEYNPYGSNKCYGLSSGAMINWIHDFSDTYKSRTGRPPVIYTSTSWWTLCTGNFGGFGRENPLWIARYGSAVGPLPAGWGFHTFWQNSDNAAPNPGDADLFNGDTAGLQRFASG
ncbi:glycoside hydrolase family 25 protein [Linnemannia elongata]|nr:glycoside hydrolase family 25 protein [Linnemannia elongata]